LKEEIEVGKGRDSRSESYMLDNSSPTLSMIALRSIPNSDLLSTTNMLSIKSFLRFI